MSPVDTPRNSRSLRTLAPPKLPPDRAGVRPYNQWLRRNVRYSNAHTSTITSSTVG